MNVAESLTTKLGPLPVWVWGLGAGVSINVARWAYNKRTPAEPPAAETDAGATADAGAGLAGGAGSFPGTGAAPIGVTNAGAWNVPADQVAGTPTTAAGPTTNAEWQTLAVEALQADGYPPLTVETSLSKYLAGNPITVAEQALVSIAFRHYGRPPEGAPTMSTAPDSPSGGTPPTAAPATPAAPVAAPVAPVAAPWQPPSWLAGVRFIKGSGNAVYMVLPGRGIEWIPSEDAFRAQGGSFNPPNWVTISDSALGPLPRVGTLPERVYDPSLP